MIKQRNHDGHTFFWTNAALASAEDAIGFYFDDRGLPQQILRNSLYGQLILMWENALDNSFMS